MEHRNRLGINAPSHNEACLNLFCCLGWRWEARTHNGNLPWPRSQDRGYAIMRPALDHPTIELSSSSQEKDWSHWRTNNFTMYCLIDWTTVWLIDWLTSKFTRIQLFLWLMISGRLTAFWILLNKKYAALIGTKFISSRAALFCPRFHDQ